MLRLTAPLGERLRDATRLQSFVAGSEANVARSLAALGAPVSWISSLPENPLGDRIIGELNAAGVDTAQVDRPASGRVGLFFAEQGSRPRATRVWYDRAGSSFAQMTDFDARALNGASFAVISGITPALGSRSRQLAERFAAAASKAGAGLCIDVNYRRLLWRPAQARKTLAPLLAGADVAVCSERDAGEVFGVDGEPARIARDFASRWAPKASAVAITRAEHGGVLAVGRRIFEQPAREVEVLDRFGAGDAFLAGLLWALLRGWAPHRVLAAASTLAELACTVVGDAAQFSAGELEAAIDGVTQAGILR
jgi:2-dehydro-3-deoxygluconokinase